MTTVLPPDAFTGSAYPRPISDLLPQARELAAKLGTIPARNELMRRLGIGAPKANELRAQLAAAVVDEALAADTDEAVEPGTDPWTYAEPTLPGLADPPVVPESAPVIPPAPAVEPLPQVTPDGHPDTPTGSEQDTARPEQVRRVVVWPIVLLALPAFVAIWSGWVGLGGLTGFGMVDLLPGIVDPGSWATIDSAITLPIGVETYGAYALYVWLSGRVPDRARRFARWSAIGSLAVGALGQVAYHLLVASGATAAPWWITMLVACLPVAVLGMGAALAHLVRNP